MRRFYLAVGGTVLLLLAMAFLAASFRAAPEGLRQEPGGLVPDRVSMDKAMAD
ncbi:MAG: hypothetical protein M0017_04875 [Desulfobacteraceae bacterium]|nr:hypothetical protein [Desulfobacteraceae bacterium]